MTPILQTAETLAMARRCVWFQPPEQALTDATHLIAHVLTYGAAADIAVLRRFVSEVDLRQALDQAPTGVIDKRSWAYWHLMLFERRNPPPMPERRFA